MNLTGSIALTMTEATMKTSVPYFFAVKGQWTIRQNVENKSILSPFHLIETPWRQFVLLFLEVMRFCYLPVLAVGNLLEFVLNVMLANGGIINTLLKVTFPCTGLFRYLWFFLWIIRSINFFIIPKPIDRVKLKIFVISYFQLRTMYTKFT